MRVNLLSYLSDSRNWFIKEHHLAYDTNSGGVILPTTFFILLLHHSKPSFSIQTHSDFEPNPYHSALLKLATFSLLIQSIFWIFIQVKKKKKKTFEDPSSTLVQMDLHQLLYQCRKRVPHLFYSNSCNLRWKVHESPLF